MMGANERLADIEFYSKAVKAFSDDGIIVPGSNYGHRILNPSPGVNQLEGIIACLRSDRHSKRAAISVYQAEDAVRASSRDIPCTFGFTFHIRDEQLHSTIIMRSNNAHLLLPFNIFEFSLLAEIVASELDVPIGPMYYHGISMHLLAGDKASAELAVSSVVPSPILMPEMPPRSLAQVRELVRLEARMRHSAAGLTDESLHEWVVEGAGKLDAYWQQFFILLLLHVARENRLEASLQELKVSMDVYFRNALGESAFELASDGRRTQHAMDSLFDEMPAVNAEPAYLQLMAELEDMFQTESKQFVLNGRDPLLYDEQVKLRNELIGSPRQPMVAANDINALLSEARRRIRALRDGE